jgi:hypothetical protein
MPVHRFTTYIGEACVKANKGVAQMAPALSVDPKDLLDMINGKIPPPAAIVRGLARELGLDPATLENMAASLRDEIKKPAWNA